MEPQYQVKVIVASPDMKTEVWFWFATREQPRTVKEWDDNLLFWTRSLAEVGEMWLVEAELAVLPLGHIGAVLADRHMTKKS